MISEQDLETLQAEMFNRLTSDAFLAPVSILLLSKGLAESDISVKLSTSNLRAGKIGAVMIVMMPFVDCPENGSVGPQLDILPIVRCIEHPQLNRGVTGTLITASAMSLRAVRLFHLWRCDLMAANLRCDKRPVRPAPLKDPKHNGYDVFFHCASGFDGAAVTNPNITVNAGTVQILCNTPLAQIWYTTDGSYPAPASGTSILYAEPFASAAGALIRAGGYKAQMIPSSVTALAYPLIGTPSGDAIDFGGGNEIFG